MVSMRNEASRLAGEGMILGLERSIAANWQLNGVNRSEEAEATPKHHQSFSTRLDSIVITQYTNSGSTLQCLIHQHKI